MTKKILFAAHRVRLTMMRLDYLVPVASIVLGVGSTVLTYWR